MKSRWFAPLALSVAGVVVIAAAGCGSKSKGTNARALTPEEQFATFEQYMGGVEQLGTTTLPIVASASGKMYWDGVQPTDFPDFGLGLLNFGGPGLAKINGIISLQLGKRAPAGLDLGGIISSMVHAAAAKTEGYQYDAARGWWVFDIDTNMSETISEQGLAGQVSLGLKLRDSVRFDNSSSNTAYEQPGSSTDRLRHGSKAGVNASATVQGQGIDINLKTLVLNATQGDAVTNMNTSTVTLNGNTGLGANIDMAATVPDTVPGRTVSSSAKGTMNLSAGSSNVTVPKSANPCPTGGSLNAGLGLDIAASRNGVNESAKGNWDMGINYTGGGNVAVSVSSGQFTREASGQVCIPTP